jgi:hypothetical protein
MPGLERLLRNLYGSTPQIDLDRQIARVRVAAPLTFDFAALVDGLKRANVGYGSAALTADVERKDGQVVLRATGQSFRLEGPPPEAGRRTLRVLDAKDPAKVRLQVLR